MTSKKFTDHPWLGVSESKAEDAMLEIFLLLEANNYASAKAAVSKYKETFRCFKTDSVILYQIKQMKSQFEMVGTFNLMARR